MPSSPEHELDLEMQQEEQQPQLQPMGEPQEGVPVPAPDEGEEEEVQNPFYIIRNFFWDIVDVNGREHVVQAYDVKFDDPNIQTVRVNAQYIARELIEDFWLDVADTVMEAEDREMTGMPFVPHPYEIHDRECFRLRRELEAAGHTLDMGYVVPYVPQQQFIVRHSRTLGVVNANFAFVPIVQPNDYMTDYEYQQAHGMVPGDQMPDNFAERGETSDEDESSEEDSELEDSEESEDEIEYIDIDSESDN